MALTKEDLQAIQNLMKLELAKEIKPLKEQLANVPSRAEVEFIIENKLEPMREQISNLPTKEEYFGSMDSLIKEVQEYRMERVALGSQVDRLEQRVEKIEAKVGIKNE